MNIETGLDYILNHFDQDNNIFPRTISTRITQNKQVEINSKKEALQCFEQANNLDCRISAFSRYEQELLKPNMIFIDLDNKTALDETRALIHKTTGGIPTVIHTGNGYAILQPINTNPWRNTTHGTKQDEELTKLFLSWSPRYLTNNKSDTGNHPSLKSCMIRIPGSYNSKLTTKGLHNQAQVKIISEWNKKRVTPNALPFMSYVDSIIRKESKQYIKYSKYANNKTGIIQYIENIIHNTPITDGRQRFFSLVLCPYLINIKKLTIEEAHKQITNYFGNYIPDTLIKYTLSQVQRKGVKPYSLSKMQDNDTDLYNILSSTNNIIPKRKKRSIILK